MDLFSDVRLGGGLPASSTATAATTAATAATLSTSTAQNASQPPGQTAL